VAEARGIVDAEHDRLAGRDRDVGDALAVLEKEQ
jgi:hypothetical protein